ncbi:MAG TPA: 3-oxoacyl-[acyl-carrier-protein] synthase III C-terminal domain-containing protein [Acidobacteriota bacterium]|nr:3-oxoacyl-[acyl-carrier-protein] synthase III C-terminal domain-containing protein [Acidobacteriota bacterium]
MSATQNFGMRIHAIAAYAPRQKVTNSRIAARLRMERMRVNAENRHNGLGKLDRKQEKVYKTSDRWIQRFIGFRERRFAAEDEGTIDLAARAALLLLDKTELKPSQIDGIVFGSVTPSYLNSPPDSAMLQDRLGIPAYDGDTPRDFHCIDCSLACSTWMASLLHAYLLISSGMARNVLVVGADKMSSTINWRDRAFATVLGDAGTATWCSAVAPEEDWFGPRRFWSWASGRDGGVIMTPMGGSSHPISSAMDIIEYKNRLAMDGAMVKELIVPLVGGPGIEAALGKAGWTMDMLDLATLHEANLTLNDDIFRQWKQRGFSGKVLDAGGLFGNTTAATIPLALALNSEALTVGSRFVWMAFGGGLSASSVLGQIKHPVTCVSAV